MVLYRSTNVVSACRWPLWALVGGGLSLLAAATDRRGAHSSATHSLVQASLTGLSVGGYIALEFFPGQRFLQVIAHTKRRGWGVGEGGGDTP